MECFKKTVRVILGMINGIMLILGGFLLFCSIMLMYSNGGTILEVNSKPVIIMLSTASITILGSLLGICGAYTEKKGCLGLYMIFIWSGLIILTVMTALLLSAKSPLESSVDDFLWKEMNLYGLDANDTAIINNQTVHPNEDFNATLFIDIIQEGSNCCGYNNYTDWANLPYTSKNVTDVPLSCCKNSSNCTGSLDNLDLIYEQGCEKPFNEYFTYCYGLLAWTTLGLAVLAFSAIVIAIGLLCSRRSNPFDYTGFGEPSYTAV